MVSVSLIQSLTQVRHGKGKVCYQEGGVAKNWRAGAPIRTVSLGICPCLSSFSSLYLSHSVTHSRHGNKKSYQEGGVAKNWRAGAPIRVVRGSKMYKKHPQYLPKEGFRYDGIYKVLYIVNCSLCLCLNHGNFITRGFVILDNTYWTCRR